MVTALDYTEEYDEMTPGSVHLEYFRRLGFMADFSLYSIDLPCPMSPRCARYAATIPPGRWRRYRCHVSVSIAKCRCDRLAGRARYRRPLVDFIRQNIWAPLGAEHDGVFTTDVSFAPIATGGFNSTLRDAARFGLMALNDGCLGQTQRTGKLDKDTYDCVTKTAPPEPPASMPMPHMNASLTASRAIAVSGGNLMPPKATRCHGRSRAGDICEPREKSGHCKFRQPETTANQLRPTYKQMLAGTRALAAGFSSQRLFLCLSVPFGKMFVRLKEIN